MSDTLMDVLSASKARSKITHVNYTKVYVPFVHEVEWSAGTRPGTTRLIVEVHTDTGLTGVGETICLLEFVEPVLARTVIPLAIGEDPARIERILKKIEGAGYYHHKRAMVAAVAGLEMALWDLAGKRAGMPLHDLWGGAYRDAVPIVGYLQSNSPALLASEAERLAGAGFTSFKVKLGMGFESDIENIRVVRQTLGPKALIRGDVNGAWTLSTAKRQLKKLEQFDLEYLEQPLPLEDLLGHAYLRKLTSIPIALDESAFTLQDVMAIVRAEAADLILLDAHEAGGLWPVRKAASVAEAAGIPITLHSGAELGISMAANLHLAQSLLNVTCAIDAQYPNQGGDVVRQALSYEGGHMKAPAGPGLGVELDRQRLAAAKTDSIRNPYLNPDRPEWFPTKPQY